MTEQIFVMVAEMQAMLDLIQKLEERIIDLERSLQTSKVVNKYNSDRSADFADRYYWEHG